MKTSRHSSIVTGGSGLFRDHRRRNIFQSCSIFQIRGWVQPEGCGRLLHEGGPHRRRDNVLHVVRPNRTTTVLQHPYHDGDLRSGVWEPAFRQAAPIGFSSVDAASTSDREREGRSRKRGPRATAAPTEYNGNYLSTFTRNNNRHFSAPVF